jgi:rod shape-determining protein MreC
VGDKLSTSGVDGVYPAGLPVAQVASVERRVDSGFARVLLAPAAAIDGVRHVLVLEPLSAQLPPLPELAASAPKAGLKGGKAAKASGAAP